MASQRRQWQPTAVLLPGKSHGQRSLVGCSPWGLEESDTTEWLYFHFSLSCIGEGNGNPLQCSCLENPRDGGAWWAAVYGVAQSRTWLKRLSSTSMASNILDSLTHIVIRRSVLTAAVHTPKPTTVLFQDTGFPFRNAKGEKLTENYSKLYKVEPLRPISIYVSIIKSYKLK